MQFFRVGLLIKDWEYDYQILKSYYLNYSKINNLKCNRIQFNFLNTTDWTI